MSKIFNKKEWIVIIGLVLIFILALMLPMNWTNKERLWHGFYWSMDEAHDFNLHTGFKAEDWVKPFYEDYVEGMFRTRQLSYYAEMISFKFWQLGGHVFIKDYSLIGLHLLNVVLLFFLVLRLTGKARAAMLGAVLFLNSGAALATLLYPFRNAKILAVTFFLVSWLILASHKGSFNRISWLRLIGLSFVVIGGLFTDEIVFFLFPLLLFYLVIRDGWKGVGNRRILSSILFCLLGGILILRIILHISVQVDAASSKLILQNTFGQLLRGYYAHPILVLKDTFYAFGAYFIRRNFGYWDLTVLGIFAALASGTLFLSAIIVKKQIFERRLGSAILLIFFIKAILLPHNSGYHNVFMPQGIHFPSLLFFSYYYVYCEALLICMALTLFIKPLLEDSKKYLGVLMLIMIISFSNLMHLRKGPQDALAFMNYQNVYRQDRIREIKKIAKILSNKKGHPVYLSFPAGDYKVIKGRQDDTPELALYQRMIPVKYLKAIEQKEAIVSYQNAKPLDPFQTPYELSNAKYFYDVYRKEIFDLGEIRKLYSSGDMVPKKIKENGGIVLPVRKVDQEKSNVVVFVKGRAALLFEGKGGKFLAAQSYGNAYQKFEFKLNDHHDYRSTDAVLKVKASIGSGGIEIVGPFILMGESVLEEPDIKRDDKQKKSDILIQHGFQLIQKKNSIQDVAQGLYYLRQAIQENPLNLSAYLAAGQAYREVGSYEEAISVFRGALIIFPQNPKIHSLLGICHKENDELPLAIYHMKRSAKIYENRYDIQNALRSKDLLVKYLSISR